jgi:hypothetical protein
LAVVKLPPTNQSRVSPLKEDLRMASPAASSTGDQSGSGTKKTEGIDDLLQRLGIEEDEIDDLIFEEEDSVPKEGMKWLALAKVHTSNYFSPQTFEQHMKVAWSPAKDIIFQHIEENLFTIQCSCLGDWIKVEKGGPWLFRQNIVCIEKYDGWADPGTIDLNYYTTWIQIHKLPVGYRNIALIKNLTEKKVGKAISVETNVNGMGNFVRVQVKLDVRQPLARFVSISRAAQREFYQIKYEKMPRYCAACGMVGHVHLECGSGEYEEDKLKWGEFLKADWSTWHGRGLGMNRGGGRSNRGGRTDPVWEAGRGRGTDMNGRGRNVPTSWRHNALAYAADHNRVEGVLDDTGSSPVKDKDDNMEDHDLDKNAKRSLFQDQVEENDNTETADEGGLVAMSDDENKRLNSAKKGSDERKKRAKKDGAISTSTGSAGSLEGSVRSQ